MGRSILEHDDELTRFIEKKTTLLNKEMRDGGERGLTGLKFRSLAAIFRTLAGRIKNPDHHSAQKNRLDALTYANYLRNRVREVNKIEDKTEEKEAALLVLRNEIAIQYKHFKKVDPKGQYTKILQHALGTNIKPSLYLHKDIAQKQKQFYLLWPLYVTGKHQESYLNKAQFSADKAFLCYLDKVMSDENLLTNSLDVELFNEIFREIKAVSQPKRDTIIEDSAEGHELIDLDIVVKTQHLERKELSSTYRWADLQMGMKLDPIRMQDFKIDSISKNGCVYGKPTKAGDQKQLKDGWYQYIILAEDGPIGSNTFKHDMRYFPCVAKPTPDTPNGPPPYKKYVAHSEIAGGLSVYAGGALKIENGAITSLDDASGHYVMETTEQKTSSLNYAKRKLCQLGLSVDKAQDLTLKVMPEMSISAKIEKYKKKIYGTLIGFFASDNPGLATRCEDRPRPPKKLRNLDANHQISSPRDEKIEESFDEKLQAFSIRS